MHPAKNAIGKILALKSKNSIVAGAAPPHSYNFHFPSANKPLARGGMLLASNVPCLARRAETARTRPGEQVAAGRLEQGGSDLCCYAEPLIMH
jgi:hypothetical protein